MPPVTRWFVAESRNLLVPEGLLSRDHPTMTGPALIEYIRDMEPGETIMIRCVPFPGPKTHMQARAHLH